MLQASKLPVDERVEERLRQVVLHAEKLDSTFEQLPRRVERERPWFVHVRTWGIPLWRKQCVSSFPALHPHPR